MSLRRIKKINLLFSCLFFAVLNTPAFSKEEGLHDIDLNPLASGTYTLSARPAPGIRADFLFDTGASMVMISDKLFRQISKHKKPQSSGKVAAAVATGKIKTIPTYTISSLVLDNGCDVGPVQVAVVRGASRNLIGLNALSRLGRITIDIQQGKLLISECPHPLLNADKVVAR